MISAVFTMENESPRARPIAQCVGMEKRQNEGTIHCVAIAGTQPVRS
jgi:hypothetical protein